MAGQMGQDQMGQGQMAQGQIGQGQMDQSRQGNNQQKQSSDQDFCPEAMDTLGNNDYHAWGTQL